jgi:catechol 2,3-dioxygenase-like lactoylglutathione lyase family enzyme
MRIKLTGVFVKDQEKALQFYTGTLGFVKKSDISAGEYRWLTVVSPEEPDGTELVLEPNNNPAARAYQEAIFTQGIPAANFFVDDIQKEYDRLIRRRVWLLNQVQLKQDRLRLPFLKIPAVISSR